MNEPITVKELIKQLRKFSENWIITINPDLIHDKEFNPYQTYVNVTGTYGFDEGEVGLLYE